MKKMLLCAALFAVAASANAEVIVDAETDFSTMTAYEGFWKADQATVEIKDGALVATNAEAIDFWAYQYEVINGVTTTEGTVYTLTAVIKSGVAGTLHLNAGTWSENVTPSIELKDNNEWTTYTAEIAGLADLTGVHVLFQSGDLVGTYAVKSVTLSHNGEKVQLPTTGNVLLSYYTGNGEAFGGWGAGTIENVEEDGKPCLQFTNETAVNSWEAQLAIFYDFVPGTKYYIGFDVKGTPAKNIPSGFQCQRNYAGCGDMTPFNITDNWEHVIIYGTPTEVTDDEGLNAPSRWLMSVGKYVGTFYMTNVTVYTESSSAVAGLEAEQKDNAVYNLMGVKVADKAQGLQNLPKGIYIVNGKKIMR